MSISSTFDRLHAQARESTWLWLFSIFSRLTLGLGFIVSGMVKIMGERFAAGLSANHPMGHYLEALHKTGYYYTFIGIAQVSAALLLLIPRTVTLGAFIYFPIILNICILTFATRFDGSLFTAPLMVLANLFLLGWNYEKWKYILPIHPAASLENLQTRTGFQQSASVSLLARLRLFIKQLLNEKFPTAFFAAVFAAVLFFLLVFPGLYTIKPRNTFADCVKQFTNTARTKAGETFCTCIHQNGQPLDTCLTDYNQSPDDTTATP
jgi:uncharacterized membrane protein YphA (DoxX/SURF4 family)